MNKSTSLFASTFGAIMALAGIEHGFGEVLQGNVAPKGVVFLSWPDSAFFRSLGGEPAMTIIPNLLVTGVLAILFSLALLIWATMFVQRKNGGFVMILISIAMLLVGGGIFPPILGILFGVDIGVGECRAVQAVINPRVMKKIKVFSTTPLRTYLSRFSFPSTKGLLSLQPRSLLGSNWKSLIFTFWVTNRIDVSANDMI
jgi:hypothetical protein